MTGPGYMDARGEPVELGVELGAGGEGSVFAIRGRPDLCAKIYRPEKAAARADKVQTMLARRPGWLVRRSLAWPVAALYSSDRAFAGFVMPAQRGAIELFQLLVPDERMQIAGWLTQRDLCAIAARLAKVVAGVHRAGHRIGDLKPQNILIKPSSGRVALIDTDSFEIHDRRHDRIHRSLVVTPEYTAPELQGRDPAAVDRSQGSDAFALAVLIHQILLGGAHPFEGELTPGRSSASVERVPGRIRRGLCPRVPGVAGIRPAPGALPFELLSEELRALFVRCFGPGHARPSERPTAAEWARALERARGAMVSCPKSQVHVYAEGLASCPWCERRARTGIDLFVAGQRWQRALAGRTAPQDAPEALRLSWLRRHVRGRMVAGSVTPAERAWLEKTGAALGLDRGRVARVLAEASAQDGRRWVTRGRVALAAAPLLVGGVCVSIPVAKPPATKPAAVSPERPPAAIGSGGWATIGKTRGGGVFLRAAPSRESDKQRLKPGTRVRLTGRTKVADGLDWSEVAVAGHAGWVATRYLSLEEQRHW